MKRTFCNAGLHAIHMRPSVLNVVRQARNASIHFVQYWIEDISAQNCTWGVVGGCSFFQLRLCECLGPLRENVACLLESEKDLPDAFFLFIADGLSL
ncbi:hypothetical protein J2776_005465 [Paraburkholderia caledonica]|uniref:Uncharacterized protein n=1 Tax=Paraburkholderia caledonica TaxID=134536 RepID=A0ABU1L6A1_9BURK|nr:hypothetical protein [Paraburkholderia caledonica]